MHLLALDVDGVLLDPERGGAGHWSNELTERLGIERAVLREHFFAPHWSAIVTGRTNLHAAMSTALTEAAVDVPAQVVIDLWHEVDFVPIAASIDLAQIAAEADIPVVLATNQSHERAADLERRLGDWFPVADVWHSARLGAEKPAREYFDAASALVDLNRSDVVFVDDRLDNVDAAIRAGWNGLHAAPHSDWIAEVTRLIKGART